MDLKAFDSRFIFNFRVNAIPKVSTKHSNRPFTYTQRDGIEMNMARYPGKMIMHCTVWLEPIIKDMWQ